jgi:hypothetical protein
MRSAVGVAGSSVVEIDSGDGREVFGFWLEKMRNMDYGLDPTSDQCSRPQLKP